MLNRMFGFFSAPESHPLIPQPLTDVVIDKPEEEITVSRSLTIFKLSKPDLYEEINACLNILKELKESKTNLTNLLTFRVAEEKRRNLLFAFNVFSLMASSGLSFTVMYTLHARLLDLAQPMIAALSVERENAVNVRDHFMNEYHDLWARCDFDTLGQAIANLRHCFISDNSPIPLTHEHLDYKWPSLGPYRLDDYCAIDPRDIKSTESCPAMLNTVCEDQKEFLACADNAYSLSALLNKNISDWQIKIDDSIANTWNPLSIGAFAATASASALLLTYLFFSWRNARKEYLNDLNREHDLLDCVTDTTNLTRLEDLSSRLDISLKNITLEGLTREFEIYQSRRNVSQEQRIESPKVAHRF